VWEPCCGTGAITAVLQRHGYDVTSTDITNHGFGTPGVDFLSCQAVPEGCRALVTNPPYGTDTPSHKGQEKSAMARAAALMSAGPFAAVIALTRRIQWFDRGASTPTGHPPALLFALHLVEAHLVAPAIVELRGHAEPLRCATGHRPGWWSCSSVTPLRPLICMNRQIQGRQPLLYGRVSTQPGPIAVGAPSIPSFLITHIVSRTWSG
jgi:hypothetical protein